jgi:hypothetical protein
MERGVRLGPPLSRRSGDRDTDPYPTPLILSKLATENLKKVKGSIPDVLGGTTYFRNSFRGLLCHNKNNKKIINFWNFD